MSEAPKRRFPFSQWVQHSTNQWTNGLSPTGNLVTTALPGDTLQDLIKIKDADPETFGTVTLANSVEYSVSGSNPITYNVTDEPYQKLAHLQSPALYSGDLVGATKVEIVAKFKVKQYPPLGSQYVDTQTIRLEWDPYIVFRFFNQLADPNWVGSFGDDNFLIYSIGILDAGVRPGSGIAIKVKDNLAFFPAHTPCHGKVFSNGVCPLGAELTDGSEIAAIDAMKEYRLDITGKDYNFIQCLQGTVNISQVSIKSTVTQNMIVDLYGVWIEVTYESKPTHGSSLLSSAG